MTNQNTPVIIKGYCGRIESYTVRNTCRETPYFNITLRDVKDPRISIVMEDIRLDEIQQNPVFRSW